MTFQLSACAEMLWPDRPIHWRAARLHEMGFGVGLWNATAHDLAALERTGARFTIMNGHLAGSLAGDPEGLLASARDLIAVGRRLDVRLHNILGAALGKGGGPAVPVPPPSGPDWLRARDTLHRLCDLAAGAGVTFALENLNPIDHPGVPFARTADVLALVSSVDRPELRINLDLYHTQLGEGDLMRWTDRCLPWVGEVQVADNPGRNEPGTGEVNWPAVARHLAALGYDGVVTLEGWPQTTSEAALDAFRAAFTV